MKNKGFTLIEIGIVLFVIGILVAIFIPSFTQNIKDTARAKALYTTAVKYFEAINQISQSCNIPKDYVVTSTGTSNIYINGNMDANGPIDILTKGR